MAETLNILLTSIGRRVSLAEAFRKTLTELGLKGRVFGADWSAMAPALYVVDEAFLVPGVNSKDYTDSLLDICRKREVGLLVPLIDPELLPLARAREQFAAIGTRIIISAPDVVETCRDKAKATEFMLSNGIGSPRVLTYEEALKGPFPVVVKERGGSSTRNVRQVHQAAMLKFVNRSKIDLIIQEYVPGTEYTVDIYAGFDGVPRVAVPRQRIQVRAGEVSKAKTVRCQDVIDEAMRLVQSLGRCMGVITAQCRVPPNGGPKFFDVNPRFGGGVPLAIEAGADFPRWIIEEHLGRRPEIRADGWQDGLVMLRYDAAVFRHVRDMPQEA